MKQMQWSNHDHIVAGTTLRDIHSKDFNNMALHTCHDIQKVIDNRIELSKMLNISLDDWVFMNQIHGDRILKVTQQDKGKGSRRIEDAIVGVDAIYTDEKRVPIGAFHADCLVILLYEANRGIIGAIHSGWKGSVKQILNKTIDQFIAEGCDVNHIHAYFSASLSFANFEVGEEVVKLIKALPLDTTPFIKKVHGKFYFDNRGLNVQMLLDKGILQHHITINKNDTFANNQTLFSYRRDPDCGRHLSYIMMK